MPLSDMDISATTLQDDLNLGDPGLQLEAPEDVNYKQTDDAPTAQMKAEKIGYAYQEEENVAKLAEGFQVSRRFEDDERKRRQLDQYINMEGKRQRMVRDYISYAGENGTEPSEADVAAIEALTTADLSGMVDDPSVIFEKAFAREVINTSFEEGYKPLPEGEVTDPWEHGDGEDRGPQLSDILKQALTEDQNKAFDMLDEGEKHLVKGQIAEGILSDYVKSREDMSYARKGLQYFANMALPFYWWYASHDAFGEPYANAFWPGNNKLEQIQYWWSIDDPKVAHDELQKAVDNIASVDPVGALNFLEQVTNYSLSDSYLDNVFGGVDIAAIVPVSRLGKAAKLIPGAAKTTGKGTAALASKLKAILKGTSASVGGKWGGPAKIKALSGIDIAQARAKLDAIKANLKQQAGLTNSVDDLQDSMDTALSIFSPQKYVTGYHGHLNGSEVETIGDNMVKRAGNTMSALENILRIERLSDEMVADALNTTKQRYARVYPNAAKSIVDIRHVNASDAKSNNDFFKMTIGNDTGDAFASDSAAKAGADLYGLRPEDYKIEEEYIGGKVGWYINTVRAVDETDKKLVDLMVLKSRHKTPDLISNIFFGALKSKDAKISSAMTKDAAVSVYGRSGVVSYLEDQAKSIVNLSKAQKADLELFIDRQRTFSKTTDNLPGIDSDSLLELTQDYRRLMGKDIDAATADAYMSFKQMKDTFWYVMNDMEYKQKTRLGVENWTFARPHTKDYIKEAAKNKLTPVANTDYIKDGIEGKLIDQVPWESKQDAGIMRIDPKTGAYDTWRKQDMTKGYRDQIDREVASGNFQIIHVSPHGREELSKLLGDEDPKYIVHYLVVPRPKSAKLKYVQLPYQEGFRIESLGKTFISQPIIKEEAGAVGTKQSRYMGDKNILNFTDRAEAAKWLPIVDEARRLLSIAHRVKKAPLSSPEYAAFKKFMNDNTPWGDREFRSMFVGPKKVFSLDHPFLLRKKDSSLAKDHKLEEMYTNFINDIDNEHNLFGGMVDMEFSRERNKLINTIETDTAGAVSLQKAPLVDPWSVYEKQATRISNDVFADDLKLKHAAMLIKEFGEILEGKMEDMLRNPYKYIVEKKIRKEADPRRRLAFQGARRSFMELVGTQSDFTRKIEAIKRNLGQNLATLAKKVPNVDTMVAGKRLEIDWSKLTENTWEWAMEKDPARLLRAVGLHSKIGMFNPLQWLMQAQGIVHTSLRAGPEIAYRAAGAVWLQKGLFFNPDHLVDFSKKAVRMGWKERDFRESFNALLKSKFYIVDHSYGLLSEAVTPRFISKKTRGQVASASLAPFKHGEFANRLMAWNAAYLKWKKQNPKLPLVNDDDIARVVKLADNYTLNMSAGSSAMWEKGWLGVPTQFFSYQARLMEQMLGGRITGAERLRLMLGYSVLYGLPVGFAGSTLGGIWPVHKDIAAYLLDNGVNVDENVVSKFMTRGLLDVMGNTLTDQDLNWSERYGPGGNPFIRDILQGNTDFFQLMMGASGRVVAGDNSSAGILADTIGVPATMMAAAWSPQKDFWPMTTQRLHELMTNISTYNNAWKAYAAYNTGKWFSKRGTYLQGDISTWDGIIAGVSGTIPTGLSEGFVMFENSKERKAYIKHITAEVKKYQQLALDPKTSFDDASAYWARINDLLFLQSDFTVEERSEIFKNASPGIESQLETIQRQYMSESPEKLDYMIRKLQGKE